MNVRYLDNYNTSHVYIFLVLKYEFHIYFVVRELESMCLLKPLSVLVMGVRQALISAFFHLCLHTSLVQTNQKSSCSCCLAIVCQNVKQLMSHVSFQSCYTFKYVDISHLIMHEKHRHTCGLSHSHTPLCNRNST